MYCNYILYCIYDRLSLKVSKLFSYLVGVTVLLFLTLNLKIRHHYWFVKDNYKFLNIIGFPFENQRFSTKSRKMA